MKLARTLPSLGLILLAVGCAHTRTATNPAQEERATEREEAKAEREEAKSERKEAKGDESDNEPDDSKKSEGSSARGTRRESGSEAGARGEAENGNRDKSRGESAGKARDAEDIEVSTSPGGLLAPGAQDRVRDKLGAPPGDAALRKAVQRFQREHGLPATGMLDHETVERLGLPPGEIFRD